MSVYGFESRCSHLIKLNARWNWCSIYHFCTALKVSHSGFRMVGDGTPHWSQDKITWMKTEFRTKPSQARCPLALPEMLNHLLSGKPGRILNFCKMHQFLVLEIHLSHRSSFRNFVNFLTLSFCSRSSGVAQLS